MPNTLIVLLLVGEVVYQCKYCHHIKKTTASGVRITKEQYAQWPDWVKQFDETGKRSLKIGVRLPE